MKVFIPAQNFSEFSSDKDARLQNKIVEVMESKTSALPRGVKLRGYSNTWNSSTDPLWYDFYAGALTVDEILSQLDGYVAQAIADAENMENS